MAAVPVVKFVCPRTRAALAPFAHGPGTLQVNSNLGTTNWVNVTNAPVVTNGMYQVTVPARSGDEFYRLILLP